MCLMVPGRASTLMRARLIPDSLPMNKEERSDQPGEPSYSLALLLPCWEDGKSGADGLQGTSGGGRVAGI